MSLVTVLRSPSTSESTSLGDSEVDEDHEDSSLNRSRASSFEGFFASKGAAYALPDGDFARRATKHGGEMQLHLQAMVNLLRDEDVLRLVVKLESQNPNRIRYLTIVSAFGPGDEEESIVMGVDWTDKATIGLVVPLYRDTNITLDGDGTALQWIHKCADNARRHNYFYPNGLSHAWVDYYNRKISSDRICLNEWHQMEDILSKRPESPIGTSTEKELVMKLIRHKLKEVMTRVDLEEVTSRQVRTILEEDTQMELREYRSFIDEEMFTILGQMDSASEIFDHVYLGSEWNASNLEELKENGVGYILNITREIDNFFPGTFCYHNIRVYDLDETELLHHWEHTYKFIQGAKNAGSKVLVHCRMGISRSASTVIAYGMKEYGWSLGDTMKYVKARRSIVQPNAGFWKQLITYEGILNSSKHRYNKLFTHEAELSEKGATKRKKIKKSGKTAAKTDEQLHPEDMDTVDNLSIESESDEQSEESSEERNEESGVLRATTDEDSGAVRVNTDGDLGDVRVTAEDNDDVFFSEDAVCQSKDDDSLPAISSPINPTVEPSKEVDEETDSIQSNSRVLQIPVMEKTELYRVCSLPVLPSNDKTKQEPNAQTNANFQRSRSLRERGPRKAQHLRNVLEGKASSDENITEFDRTKKGICDSTEENLCLNDRSSVETELESKAPGGLPSDLHGVLESGFVKRKSRNFEEGVYNVPSVKLVLDDAVDLEKEMDVEFAPSESDNPIATEEEQEQSVHSEEPEPGLVKKHKEEYELKHRESLKRGAVLQRGGSGDGSSLKRERGDDIDAAGLKSSLGEDGSETEGACAVNVDALVQKVNEDMKKEVSARRISKKELELRAFVRQAGEEMEEALATTEDKNLERENENSITDLGSLETSEVPSVEKKAKEMLLEDPPASGKSAECIETVASKVEKVDMRNDGSTATDIEQAVSATVDPSKNIVTERGETSELSEDREDITSEQDKENVSQESLVKRHTLLIEGRLQPLGQKLEKEGEGEVEKEGEPTVEQEVFSRSPSKEETKTAAVEIEPSVAEDVNADAVAQSTERETCDMSNEREDKASEQDTESVPQKGLVKRHTLLIEGRLQPLEQALAEAENEAEKESESKDDQQTCSSPSKEESRDVATNMLESSDEEGVSADLEPTEKEMNTTEKKETCELLEDTGDRVSEQDVLQKGLVKHHTQMIEGRLQPLGQELDREGEDKDKDEKVDEFTVGQETCSSPSKVETKSAVLAPEQVLPSVAGDLSAEDKSTTEGEGADRSEDGKDKTNEHDEEQLSQRGLVKHHKLMIEGKLQPLVQDVENEDKKQGEQTVDPEVFSFPSVDQGQRYQIEQTSNVTAEEDEGENQDGENVSGLVKREKLRIEERVKPKVEEGEESKQEEDTIVTFNDGAMLLVSDGENGGCGDAENIEVAEDDRLGELLKEQELNEVSVDTSSVVRVKDHTEHLEGIIRVTTTKDGEKIERQISKEDLPKSSDETPKIVIVPRSCSDERVGQEDERSTSDMLIERGLEEILSDSAVNVALMKAQENLDLENEKFVDWDVANVKQRTRIFEDIRQHFDKNNQKDEDDDNPIRRCGSMPKTILPSQKYVLRRRSFSDLSQTVSSSSGRKVGYTIQFSNGQSSSSSSLPREWSPLQKKQENDTWDEVFSPEIYRQGELKEKTSEALIDCQDQENNSLSVKEKIQVLDSKNHRNTSNVS